MEFLAAMANVSADNGRELVHTRQITCRAFRLENGLLEIEAVLSDEKDQAVAFRSRPPVLPGELMHRMSVTMKIDSNYLIQDVTAKTLQAPWPMCGGTDADYRKLVGLKIGAGFSQQVRTILGGVQGCTHVTELVLQIANTYMQASWPDRIARQMAVDPDPRHWPDKSTLAFVDHCHAWRRDGATLIQEYPEMTAPKKPL